MGRACKYAKNNNNNNIYTLSLIHQLPFVWMSQTHGEIIYFYPPPASVRFDLLRWWKASLVFSQILGGFADTAVSRLRWHFPCSNRPEKLHSAAPIYLFLVLGPPSPTPLPPPLPHTHTNWWYNLNVIHASPLPCVLIERHKFTPPPPVSRGGRSNLVQTCGSRQVERRVGTRWRGKENYCTPSQNDSWALWASQIDYARHGIVYFFFFF